MILINGKIHTMAEPEIIESGFIEIQDKKIVRVGSMEDYTLRGKWFFRALLMPIAMWGF